MRISLRLIVSLVVGVTLLSIPFAVSQVKTEKRGLRKELENRASIVGETLEAQVETLLDSRSRKRLQAIVTEFGNREHLKGIAIFNKAGDSLAQTPGFEKVLPVVIPQVIQVISSQAKLRRLYPAQWNTDPHLHSSHPKQVGSGGGARGSSRCQLHQD